MNSITSAGYQVFIGPLADSPLQRSLSSADFKKARKFVLVDENSLRHCFPKLVDQIPELREAEVIEVESGEQNKNLEICTGIWEALSEMHADRQAVLINLGGGVICDMGGFIASAYKRGIRFIHVPTTLLSQVDASVGGKVGVDLGGLKNQIGFFANPQAVYIDPEFLKSLDKREILSGFAEVIKHGLIADRSYWEMIRKTDLGDLPEWTSMIARSVEIKNEVVLSDPFEKGRRKILNFGHTVGHAIETLFLEGEYMALTHGESIAIGMICESWLSNRYGKLSDQELHEIVDLITNWFPYRQIDDPDFLRLVELMKNDKKNQDDSINFTLLDSIGSATVNKSFTASEIKESLRYYLSLQRS